MNRIKDRRRQVKGKRGEGKPQTRAGCHKWVTGMGDEGTFAEVECRSRGLIYSVALR